jgi:hypothetical protein
MSVWINGMVWYGVDDVRLEMRLRTAASGLVAEEQIGLRRLARVGWRLVSLRKWVASQMVLRRKWSAEWSYVCRSHLGVRACMTGNGRRG